MAQSPPNRLRWEMRAKRPDWVGTSLRSRLSLGCGMCHYPEPSQGVARPGGNLGAMGAPWTAGCCGRAAVRLRSWMVGKSVAKKWSIIHWTSVDAASETDRRTRAKGRKTVPNAWLIRNKTRVYVIDLHDGTESISKRRRMAAVQSSFQIRRMVPQMMATTAVSTLVRRTKKRVVEGMHDNVGVLENGLRYLG